LLSVMHIGQVTHAMGEVAGSTMVGDHHMTSGLMCVEKHKQVGRVVAFVFAIVPL
jgi:hypothetical protein